MIRSRTRTTAAVRYATRIVILPDQASPTLPRVADAVAEVAPDAVREQVALFCAWYNDRPHMTLHGATPDEVYFDRRPASRAPRFEPRAAWPRGSPCSKPLTLVRGQPGVQLSLTVTLVAGRRHLPRVTLARAA
jgi:hypothetical protein